jgi:beta-lactamase regulating signal transducer with metallopeptidase domain/ribosomal protein L32E
MNAIIQSELLQALGWAVLNSLWQMALLWVLYNSIQSFYRASSSQKSRLATILLAGGFAWFVFTFFSSILDKQQANVLLNLNILPGGANQQANHLLKAVLPYASAIYLILFLVPLFRFIRNYRYAQALRTHGTSKSVIDWKLFVKKVSARMGIKKTVTLWVSEWVHSPVTIGYLKPVILMPLTIISHLTPQQVEAVLLHELAHIRRHDYLVNLLIHFIQAVLYFNPFVKLFIKTIEKEREKSCDEIVMQFRYDPHSYAEALLKLEIRHQSVQILAIAASGKNNLLQRIERIMGIEQKKIFSVSRFAGLAAAFLCILVLNAVLTTTKPENTIANYAPSPFELPLHFADNNTTANSKNAIEPFAANTKPNSLKVNSTVTKEKISNKQKEPKINESDFNIAYRPSKEVMVENPDNGFSGVSVHSIVVPELNKREMKEVEKTVEATKKIMAVNKWKELEIKIADALTTAEKEQLKEKYLVKLNQVNWKNLNLQLQLSYDHLNWDKINNNLNSAMIDIKLDSLEKAYSTAEENLAKAEEMITITTDSLNSTIPIPDISLEQIRQGREQILKNIETIKAIRNKKIVHL